VRTKVPGYRRHATGQGFVTLNGRNIYCGKYEDPASKLAYDRIIREWLDNGRSLTRPETKTPGDITVNELLELFMKHAEGRYVKNGKHTGQVWNFRMAVRAVRTSPYAETPAKDFGAVPLRRVREMIVDEGKLCRGEVNRRTKLIGQIFRWGVEQGLIPPAVAHSIREVTGLRRGQSPLRDPPRVKPVPRELVDATLPFLSAQCRAMVLLQWETGMRPGEVVLMRPRDIDQNWDYRPSSHKTEHHQTERVIYLRPQARAILEPWLEGRGPDQYLFSAREAMDAARPPSQIRRRAKKHPKKQPGDHFSTCSYRHAIEDACRKAGVERWHPHQLRHSFLTRCEDQCGAETARVQAGHSKTAMTEHYIVRDRRKARDALDRMS
jgi:integrase